MKHDFGYCVENRLWEVSWKWREVPLSAFLPTPNIAGFALVVQKKSLQGTGRANMESRLILPGEK